MNRGGAVASLAAMAVLAATAFAERAVGDGVAP